MVPQTQFLNGKFCDLLKLFVGFHIAQKKGDSNPEHHWMKHSRMNGRMLFKLDLAKHTLMEKRLSR
jgi:hypothetical protein